jgi:hypothetical protein
LAFISVGYPFPSLFRPYQVIRLKILWLIISSFYFAWLLCKEDRVFYIYTEPIDMSRLLRWIWFKRTYIT